MRRETVVIIGAGFGGMNAARSLQEAPVDVILIDKHNYHLFQPLLYQVATAGLSPTDIAYPVRAIFRKQKNLEFHLTEVTRIDVDERCVQTTMGPVMYDYLIVAVGGETNYFGVDSVAENGFDLKSLEDAVSIRNHILSMFELAEQVEDPEDRMRLRTIVIVGGGPTGVECAGAISELVRLVLQKDYPNLEPTETRIILLEMLDRLLAAFPESLSRKALDKLQQKRVDVRFQSAVTRYDGRRVELKDGGTINAATLIWAAGVRASGLLNETGLPQGKQGRVVVEPTLQVPGHPNIYVIGDAAFMEDGDQPLPMVAPVAIQQAKVAARNIRRTIEGMELVPFEYKDPGSLATIGRNAAVARVKGINFSGFLAWVVWLVVHLFWLVGFRNRLLVMVNWIWDYFLYDRGVRLISSTPRKLYPEKSKET